MHKRLIKWFGPITLVVLACLALIYPAISGSSVVKIPITQGPVQQINDYFSTQTTTYSDGTMIDRNIISGPPKPPPGYQFERATVMLPNKTMASNSLTVPAFKWVFGCAAVSGAMIAGYYDRNGFPNMYTGPANGGVMPLDNSTAYWPTWTDVKSELYPNLPLAASHNGADGMVTRGSIDDYWIQNGSSADDPYITGSWTQHTWSDAIGDYMKTSQSAYGNKDSSTTFSNYTTLAQPLTCANMLSDGINTTDGTYGRKLFYEARGYMVTDCYNQKTDNTVAGGFSFTQYKAEIDAGRPVMLNLEGHTVVGVGYNDSVADNVIIHDTWDHNHHAFPWGGSYSEMQLLSVSIVNLAAPNPVPTLSGISPLSAFMHTAAFTLTVNGSNFVTGSVVRWNGASRTTTFVSATKLTAAIPATDIAHNGTFNVTVFNSTPGGGTSNAKTFTVSLFIPPTGGGGKCFIATAAFGTPMERHVQILRDFRDRVLLTTSAGQAFVKFYYEVSPPIAGKIAQSEGLRFITRASLMPFVGMAYLMVTYGAMATLLIGLTLILMVGALVMIIRRKMMVVNP